LKKIAFFVEGLTEQYFIENLLKEVFNQNKLAIQVKKIKGGSKIPITITEISSPTLTDLIEYYVLIFDCGGESTVKSYILDQRESLIKSGYSKIVGILDVFPNFSRTEIHDLRYGLNYKVPQKEVSIKFVISIMEIEAWFLAEEIHFSKINALLTADYIEKNYGFNPSTYNTELRDEPANDLNNIYQLVGECYSKNKISISKTVEALDYSNVYFKIPSRITSLKELITEIDEIFE